MRIAKTLLIALTLVSTIAIHAQETPAPPFTMPTPEGWRNETIPFPLEFAPNLGYEGIEEIRFSPGMMESEESR